MLSKSTRQMIIVDFKKNRYDEVSVEFQEDIAIQLCGISFQADVKDAFLLVNFKNSLLEISDFKMF